MTTTVKALGGGAQPAAIDTSGKMTGGPALRVYGFDSAEDAQAAGYNCEGGPAMSVALITDEQIASGAWKVEGDPAALVVYTAPASMSVVGSLAVPVYAVNGWGSVTPPVPPLFLSAEIGTVNASTVAVTFDQDIDAAGNDYSGGVTIKVNGTATSITSATRQSNHAIVRYVIPVLWHGSGDAVTWEYASASGSIVSEVDSILLDNVTAQSVTNNCEYLTLNNIQADSSPQTDTSSFSGSGTITQDGTTITGDGTLATHEIVIGDRIVSSGNEIDGIVTSISSAAVFDIDTTASVAVGVSYNIIPQSGTARINTLIDQVPADGHNFTQTGTARPSLQTIGGYLGIVSDGWNDYMNGGNFADDLASMTVFVVAQSQVIPQGSGTFISKFSDGSNSWDFTTHGTYFFVQQTPINANYLAAGSWEESYSDAIKRVFSAVLISRAEAHVYANGVEISDANESIGTITSYSNDSPVLLVREGLSGDFTNPIIYAVMICAPIPSAVNRAALEARLAARYGVTL